MLSVISAMRFAGTARGVEVSSSTASASSIECLRGGGGEIEAALEVDCIQFIAGDGEQCCQCRSGLGQLQSC